MGIRVKEYIGGDSLPPKPESERSTEAKHRRRVPWQIKVAEKPLEGREGTRWLVIAVSSERVIWICPTASTDERLYALNECMQQLHSSDWGNPFDL
jgi:hypothetical protein